MDLFIEQKGLGQTYGGKIVSTLFLFKPLYSVELLFP